MSRGATGAEESRAEATGTRATGRRCDCAPRPFQGADTYGADSNTGTENMERKLERKLEPEVEPELELEQDLEHELKVRA